MQVTGEGTALRYDFVECFAWASLKLFEAAEAWFVKRDDVVKAGWHNYLRDGSGFWLKATQEADADVVGIGARRTNSLTKKFLSRDTNEMLDALGAEINKAADRLAQAGAAAGESSAAARDAEQGEVAEKEKTKETAKEASVEAPECAPENTLSHLPGYTAKA